MLKDLFTDNMLGLVLIAISAYLAAKTLKTRNVNGAARAFCAFAFANLVFQVSDLCMSFYRTESYFTGAAAGCVLYIVTLTAMAVSAWLWFVYVEKAVGSRLTDTAGKTLLTGVPALVFAVLCVLSARTGWIFSFDADGKYLIGSLFFLQYVFIFGYCLIAMIRSGVNYLLPGEKRDTDRILFIIMLVDTAAVVIQLCWRVNTMHVALTLTALLAYINVYTAEVQQIRAELKKDQADAAEKNEERRKLAENSSRFFALEDEFVSLYDVELESGQYVSFDRDEFYRENISDKLVPGTEFFGDLRANVERVIWPEDREGVYNVQTRESILSGLAQKEHIDHYYRIITENGPVWLKMRIVYKDASKKNVIVGVFNAEEEMAARRTEEQARAELAQTNSRLFALEDNFESMYDVDLESGHYDVFVKGDFYRSNVLERLSEPKDYFRELRGNIDAVIWPEDREGLFRALTKESIRARLAESERYDHYYRLISENGPVWFRMRIVYGDAEKKNVIIGVFSADEEMAAREKETERLKETEQQLRHEQLREEILSRMMDYSGDPVELLKGYAERVRVLIGCDQVIYRDLEETRIMVNSDGIADTWSVPIEYCRQCQHFDAHHPMYRDGYTEMEDCRAGWQGIPVYEKCPIKSSLTRIVYCDGEPAGYLAIHYVQEHHRFTDMERETAEVFARILSISLSRYLAKKENRELKLIQQMQGQLKEALTFTNYFLDTYVSAYYVNFRDDSCQVYKRTAELEEAYPIVSGYFGSLTEYIGRDVHPDDREELYEIVRPENMKRILGEQPEYSHIFRDISGGKEKMYRMQVIRGADGDHAAFGFIDISTEVSEQRARQAEEEESRKLIASIAATYNLAYAVNMTDDSFRLLRMDEDVIGSGEKFATFSEAKDFFIALLPASDREKMRHELDYGTIRERLAENASYDTEYRVPIRGAIIWHEMNITRIDDEHVAIGFAKKDLEITKKHLEDKRFSEYFALYEIDLDTGMLKIVKDSPYYGIDRSGTAMPYAPAMQKFSESLDGEAREFFERLTDLDNIRRELAAEDKWTYAYRSNNVGDRNWVDCTSYVTLRHDDGTPAMFTFGFSMVDSLGVYRQELQSKYKEALDVVSEEKQRNDLLHNIIHSGKWSFRISADDRVVSAAYSEEVKRVINNDFSSGVTDWVEILHPDDKETTLAAFRAAIEDHTCRTPYDVAFRMADRNGEYHWFHSAGRIVRNADGSGEFFGIHIDITSQIEEQIRQKNMLEDARTAADAANRAKSNFLFNMSHDIRTPMNAIRGFTAMAKKYADDGKKVGEYLDKIDVSGQQLLTLINQVLEMARIESGKARFEENPVNIREEFGSMVTVLTEQARTYGLNFTYELGDIEHNRVLADEAKMNSITLNITGNAMKYTPEGGSIGFSLKEIPARRPGYATFVMSVSDTGIGMSREYLAQLYEPFTREQNTTVSRIQGTGLGMSIVKSTIDLLGGEIAVESEPGKGTRFDITVDFRIDVTAEQADDKAENTEAVSFEGRRVLLVEDNEMNREIARDILEEQGLIVEDADDGDVAVSRIREIADRGEYTYYDFILMDIQMPRMNGYEASKAIREIPMPEGVRIPIIAMTANAFEEDRQNALAAGMDEHLAKPIDVQKLFMTMARFM